MRRPNRWLLGLAALPLALAASACDGGTALPTEESAASSRPAATALPREDAIFVMRYILVSANVELERTQTPQGVRTVATCVGGGTVTTVGTRDVKPRSGGGAVEDTHLEMSPSGCGFTLGDNARTVFVSTTEPLVYDWRYSAGHLSADGSPVAPPGTGRNTMNQKRRGTFTWSTPDGRSGSCEIKIDYYSEIDYDKQTTLYKEKGTICGYEMDEHKEGTLPYTST